MERNDSEILSKVGRNPGFKVPENYFADFAKNMASSLPERDFTPERRTLWQQLRPWVYMAAMFAGIWCTMYVFTSLSGANSSEFNQSIAEAFSNESFVDDFVLTNDFNEYTLVEELYADSVDVEADTIANAE
ncbi:MAG: hypothetical protein PUD30_07975 [Muribaculaceae bacterium]|nr:hypothetical protein [Muribaculaceae bacterium]MDY3932787.1 hypothetical protein [Muribaculaceae bacterium]